MNDISGDVRIETIDWTWAGQSLQAEVAWLGAGPIIVLLPALSSIATRHEMAPLQHQLAERFTTVAVDWPGFGTRACARTAWTPGGVSCLVRLLRLRLVMARVICSIKWRAGPDRQDASGLLRRLGVGRCRPWPNDTYRCSRHSPGSGIGRASVPRCIALTLTGRWRP